MSVATVWNFKTWAGTWQRRMKHTVTLHTLEKRTGSYCGIPSQSTSRPILTWYLWCGTGASVDITFKMLKVMQVTSWHLKHVGIRWKRYKIKRSWPKNGLKRFPKARTIWNYLKLLETIPNLIDITYAKPPERFETVLRTSCSGIVFLIML